MAVQTREDLVIEAVVQYVRREVLADFSVDSCIETCGVARGVLNNFKMNASFMPCCVQIFNPEYVAFWDANKRHPKDAAEMDLFKGWVIRIGDVGKTEGRYDGHLCLVLRLRGKPWLMDLSIDQASRPHRNVVLPPFAIEVPEAFVEGKETTVVKTTPGCMMIYKHHPDLSYRKTKAWTRTVDKLPALERATFLVGQYLKRMGFDPRK